MAKITANSKKVKGTKKKDTITWKSSSAQYKSITVYGNNGSDTIDFKKSKYKNKLNGGNGDDSIYGGKKDDVIHGNVGKDILYGYNGNDKIYGDAGNDKIWGGKGKDIINSGKGTNTIYHSKGDGNDTILKGGGTDTLVIKGEKSINSLIGYASGNNVIIKRPNGEKITLKDYMKGRHSVKYVQVGNKKVKTEEIRNLISSNKQTVNGTAWGDNIYTTGVNARVYAGAGNDIIHITLDSNNPELYLGKGNDIISLEADDRIVNIHFEGADGKNILTGLSNPNIKSAAVSFYSSDMFNKVYSPNGQILFEYIKADRSENDMVIQVANNSFTIKDFYRKYTYYNEDMEQNVETICGNKLMGYYCDPITAYDGSLRNLFYESDKIQTLVSDADEYPDEVFDTQVGLRNNLIFSTFSSGDNANVNTRTINVNGQRNSIVAISNAVNQDIVLGAANNVYSATSNGGINTIRVGNGGGTQISVAEGNHKIYLTGENSAANIAVGDATLGSGTTVNIYGAGDATNGTQFIYAEIDDYDNYYAPMFSHYYNANANSSFDVDDYISVVVAKKVNEDAANYTEFIPQDIKIWGTWSDDSFDLDTEHFGNNELRVNGEGGCFKELTQFVDMGEVYSATGYHKIDYDNAGTFLDIAKDYYIYSGGEQDETYDYMKLSRSNAIAETYVETDIVIDDRGGNDTLNFDADCSELSFFFDVKRDGDSFVLGDDLIFTSDLHNYIYDDGDYSTLTIKNAFGGGKMETLTAESGDYKLNYDFLTSNEKVGGVDTVYMELVSWLSSDGSAYGSISEALGSDDAAALYTIYSGCIGDYTNTWKLA